MERRLREEDPKPGSRDYIEEYFGLVIADAEISGLHFAAFVPPVGNQLLIDYVLRLKAEGYAPPSRANRLSVIRKTLEFAWDRGWIPRLPRIPKPTVGKEVMRIPKYEWQTEADFLALRDGLWSGNRQALARLHVIHKRDGGADAYIARRRLYMSFGFLGGFHTVDLDNLVKERVSPDTGHFERVNQKSASSVPSVWLKMPERLHKHVIEELERLGRFWRAGEPIAGGRWSTVARTLTAEAERLGLPVPVNPRIWRRTVARTLALLGWSEADCSEYLGHVDQRMIREVYRRIPIDMRSPVKLEWTIANVAKVTGGITARAHVFTFEKRPAGSHRGVPRLHSIPDEGAAEHAGKPSRAGTKAAK